MSNLIEREFQLTEILVKTTYQIVISKEQSFQSQPIAFGAGFFLIIKTNYSLSLLITTFTLKIIKSMKEPVLIIMLVCSTISVIKRIFLP